MTWVVRVADHFFEECGERRLLHFLVNAYAGAPWAVCTGGNTGARRAEERRRCSGQAGSGGGRLW